jgi:hypothetical protein
MDEKRNTSVDMFYDPFIPPDYTILPSPSLEHSPAEAQQNPTGNATNRVYIPYGVGSGGVVQIVDRTKLLNDKYANPVSPTDAELLDAQIGRIDMSPDQGGHTMYSGEPISIEIGISRAVGRWRRLRMAISIFGAVSMERVR